MRGFWRGLDFELPGSPVCPIFAQSGGSRRERPEGSWGPISLALGPSLLLIFPTLMSPDVSHPIRLVQRKWDLITCPLPNYRTWNEHEGPKGHGLRSPAFGLFVERRTICSDEL